MHENYLTSENNARSINLLSERYYNRSVDLLSTLYTEKAVVGNKSISVWKSSFSGDVNYILTLKIVFSCAESILWMPYG